MQEMPRPLVSSAQNCVRPDRVCLCVHRAKQDDLCFCCHMHASFRESGLTPSSLSLASKVLGCPAHTI